MRKLIRKLAPGAALLGLLALIAVTPATVGDAQIIGVAGPGFTFYDVEFAGRVELIADDTQVMAIAKYMGVPGTGHVAATTTLQVGADAFTFLLDGAAVTTFECPITAVPWDGIIDTTNAACDTYGEVEDIINLYGYDDGWRFVLINAKRSDLTNSALIVGALSVADELGQTILHTTAEAMALAALVDYSASTAVLTPAMQQIAYYLGPAPTFYYVPKPFQGLRSYISDVDWFSTYTGTSDLVISEEKFEYTDTRGTPTMSIGTENDLFAQVSGATTATADADILDVGIFGRWGYKVFVRMEGNTDISVITQQLQAYMFHRGAGGGVEGR